MAMGEKQDVLVIGAGVFGLSAALGFAQAGHEVLLIDKASHVGAGASGGLVGTLSPYMPENWNVRKAAQLRALSTAPRYWADVAALGGVDPHYGQTGRWLPLMTAREAELAPIRGASAAKLWGEAGQWHVESNLPEWLNPAAAPFGAVRETLSARIDPRRACRALLAAFTALGGVFQGEVKVEHIQPGRVETDTGSILAKLIVVATGATQWPGFPKMRGVKGQAALLEGGLDANTPSLYADGLYVIAHADGRVAVGSTSEESFAKPNAVDEKLDDLLARAIAVCPVLKDQPIVERWAGLRPRSLTPEPILGWMDEGVLLATGGFRTGLAMAPLVAEALVDIARGDTPNVPPHYHIQHHLMPR